MIVHLEIYDISDNLDWDGEDKLVAAYEGSPISAAHISAQWRDVGEHIHVSVFSQSDDCAPLTLRSAQWLEDFAG